MILVSNDSVLCTYTLVAIWSNELGEWVQCGVTLESCIINSVIQWSCDLT